MEDWSGKSSMAHSVLVGRVREFEDSLRIESIRAHPKNTLALK